MHHAATGRAPSVPDDSQREDARSRLVAPSLIWVMVLVSLLPWRNAVYYSGGVDAVVAGKALTGCAALAAAWALAPAGALQRLGARTAVIVTAYVAVTLIGALAGGTLLASGVLAVRVLIVLATLAFLALSLSRSDLAASMAIGMVTVLLVLAVTGVGASLARGRLTGGILPAPPNQMVILCGPPALYLAWRVIRREPRFWEVAGLGLLVGFTWATGSRTGLAALMLGIGVILLLAPHLRLGALATVVLGLPAALWVAGFTPLLHGFFARGGEQNILTLNSRTIAWRAAFAQRADFYQYWFGGGLSVKTVNVTGTYWNTQVLDSSWLSSLVQAGLVGVVLLAALTATTLWLSARDRSTYRALWLALTVYAVLNSFLETGLLDTYVLFVIMLVPALCVDIRRPTDAASAAPDGHDVADARPSPLRAIPARDR